MQWHCMASKINLWQKCTNIPSTLQLVHNQNYPQELPEEKKVVRNQNYPWELLEQKKSSAFSNTAKQVAAHNILRLSRTVLHIICTHVCLTAILGRFPFSTLIVRGQEAL